MQPARFTASHRARSYGVGLIPAALVVGLGLFLPARAAAPPTSVNWQGVLRDQTDKPLTGTYDIVLRFMDAAVAGNEILVDQHTAANANAVTVTGGLFNVALGSGTVLDGGGPGTYTSLDAVFRDFDGVWLEVVVGAETLSPRTLIRSSAYALNATNLAGHPSSYFLDTSTTTQTKNGQLEVVSGSAAALYAHDTGSGYGLIAGSGNGYAIWASGSGGIFGEGIGSIGYGGNFSGSTAGVLATGADTGVIAQGSTGGRFWNTAGQVVGEIGTTTRAVNASGGDYAGYFQTSKPSSTGVYASGSSTGGTFTDSFGDSATLASAGRGISASAPNVGSYFSNGSPYFAYTQIPYYDLGIFAYGVNYGGQFNAFTTGNFAQTAYSTYKIIGTGTVSFVQNHPDDPSKVIAYVAPEGDEAAVYTRGSGRLVNGEARVELGETFALVANPDIGLTATATPRGDLIPLTVSEVSPGEIVVRGPAGSSAAFDYMVWGLRIGFEEQSIVQPKQLESRIPSMHLHDEFFKHDPGLRKYTALARFQGVEEAVHGRKNVDHSHADRLREAVGVSPYRDPSEFEHAVGKPDDISPVHAILAPGRTSAASAGDAPASAAATGDRGRQAGTVANGSAAPGPQEATAGFDLFTAEGIVEAGDVVSLSPVTPGTVARSSGPADALVIGCVQIREGAAPAGQVGVATSHVARCRVDATLGVVSIGDRLISSPEPGLAMKADPGVAGAAILGRAIDPLTSGEGLIRVLLGAR